MVQIKWNRDAGKLEIAGHTPWHVESTVRNEKNGLRKLGVKSDVVYSVVNGEKGPPYMPRPFPRGRWKILGIEIIADQKSPFYPVKIRTNATQPVETWDLDPKTGGYLRPNGKQVIDGGYHIHNGEWTQGCGGVDDPEDRDGVNGIPEVLRLASVLWGQDAELEVF